MTEQELDALLVEIKNEGLAEIDQAADHILMGTGYELLLEVPEGVTIASVRGNTVAARRRKARRWWEQFMAGIKEWVRSTVCCKAIPVVDTPEERAVFIDKFLKALYKVVPVWVSTLVHYFEDKAKRLLEAIFSWLVGLAQGMCDNVNCVIAPLPVEA